MTTKIPFSKTKEYQLEYRRRNKAKHRKYMREYINRPYAILKRNEYRSRPEVIVRTKAIRSSSYYKRQQSERRRKIKRRVFSHYSPDEIKCACCGEAELAFLSIDHVNGGGNKHRAEIDANGQSFYGYLIRNNFPEGYQVLCFNCNMAKGFFGVCPHKTAKGVVEVDG